MPLPSRSSQPAAFHPAWWLPGPHAPTVWGKFGRRQPAMHDRLERWGTPDADHLTIARMGQTTPGTPHLLVLHGLEGKLTANYAQGLLGQAKRRGWSADLLLFRSCDGETNSARRFYHSGETTDLDFVVNRLVEENPHSPLFLAGLSLGGNVLLKWLGERGDATPIQLARAAAGSVPFDLEAGSIYMEKGFARLYVKHFLASLIQKTLAKMDRFPDICDHQQLLHCASFRDFDNIVTGPLHGFADAHDYYNQSSSIHFLSRIRVPTLLLSARDDPFLPPRVLDSVNAIAATNDSLRFLVTPRGGHVGWIEGQPWKQRYFMEELFCEWFDVL